jgi:uncharacterized protein YigA (DUF484 family)
MNWQEIAGSVVNALRNAGVKKDVIDLQEKQLALLTDKIVTLEREKSDLMMQTTNLHTKATDLELELKRLRPKQDELEEDAVKILLLLFEGAEFTTQQIAERLGITKGWAEHHCGVLFGKKMIHPRSIRVVTGFEESSPTKWMIVQAGRDYLVKNKLV